ncbi:hypothetical protein DYB30_007581 [Aphanomyces astaci]|uniref:phospholipase D n=1 Tax=Aphanomyces astaci TaxID=112090 RepID=A0A397DV90_APHAT|nr:hypothetical protein DYB30_007581 [Aphanomyces astaci]
MSSGSNVEGSEEEYKALDSPSSVHLHDDLGFRLPGAPLVRVVNVERVDSLMYTYNMFVIELSLPDNQTWRIRTTTPRLFSLHFFLQRALRFRHVFEFPSSLLAHHTSSVVPHDVVTLVESFLTDVLSHKSLWRHPRVLAFVEYSALRFDPLAGDSLVEGWVKMRYVPSRKGTLHGRHSFIGFHFTKDNLMRVAEIAVVVSLCVIIPFGVFYSFVAASSADSVSELHTGYMVAASILSAIPGLYFVAMMYQYLLRHRRWMVVKPSSIAFFDTVRSTAPTHVVLFQPHIAISKSTLLKHGLHWMMDGLHVTTPAAIVEIDFKHKGQCQHFHEMLTKAMDACDYTTFHQHTSFAPMRPAVDAHRTNVAQHLVDGEETFAVMFEHLGRATRQIFITGWWISPHYALVRTSAQARLDSELYTVLRAAAARGVQVFVLVYREHHLVLPNDSKFAKESLQGTNIHVLRHPDFVVIPQFWSHHEKIVCIDQTVAFVGGLDIALGRYNVDIHSGGPTFSG